MKKILPDVDFGKMCYIAGSATVKYICRAQIDYAKRIREKIENGDIGRIYQSNLFQ